MNNMLNLSFLIILVENTLNEWICQLDLLIIALADVFDRVKVELTFK